MRALRRIIRDTSTLRTSPPQGISLVLADEGDVSDVQVWIAGPEKTPYEGHFFRVRFHFGSEFPSSPPQCWFVTKIYHPNVAQPSGEICVNTLKKDWTSSTTLSHICTVIKCLLIHPNAESALNEEAGKQILEEYEEFGKRAKMWCVIHAKARPTIDAGGNSTQPTVAPTATAELGRATAASQGKKGSADEGGDKKALVHTRPRRATLQSKGKDDVKPLQGTSSNSTSNAGSVPPSPALSQQAGAGRDLWTSHPNDDPASVDQENTDPKPQVALTAATGPNATLVRVLSTESQPLLPVKARLPVVEAPSIPMTSNVPTKKMTEKKRALKRL